MALNVSLSRNDFNVNIFPAFGKMESVVDERKQATSSDQDLSGALSGRRVNWLPNEEQCERDLTENFFRYRGRDPEECLDFYEEERRIGTSEWDD